MPDIKDTVGDGGANKVHDVCLVQAMLKVVKNAKGAAYLGVGYSGTFDAKTKDAIIKFQTDFGLIPAAAAPVVPPAGGGGILGGIIQAVENVIAAVTTDKKGFINIAGPTLQKLSAMLPATHATMRIIQDTKTVYIEGSATDLAASKTDITGDTNFEEKFRPKLANLVEQMYATHKIVLWVTSTGHRRTFAQQAALSSASTKAGPGESNHNFGRAADLGFKNFQWVQTDGSIKKDNDWLNTLEALNAAKALAFWDKRDAIATSLGLFMLNFERIHVQAFDDSTVSNAKSLAKLLTTVGTMTWEARYKTDFGFGKGMFFVGSAKDIWAGNATVTAANLATAKGVAATAIKASDIADMQKALKHEFELADTNFIKWEAVAP